jgi:hypothetical protein
MQRLPQKVPTSGPLKKVAMPAYLPVVRGAFLCIVAVSNCQRHEERAVMNQGARLTEELLEGGM